MKINILFEYLRLLKKRLFLYLVSIFFMTVFGAFFDVAGSMLTKQVFAVAQKKYIIENDILLFGVYIIAGLVSIILSAMFMKIYNNQAKRGSVEIKQIVFAKSLRFPMDYYYEHHSAELISKIIFETDAASEIYGSRLRRVVAPIIYVFVYIIVMLRLSIPLTTILILFNIFIVIINGLLAKPMRLVSNLVAKSNVKMTKHITNIISGIEVKKLYDTKYRNELKYINESNSYVKYQKRKMIIDALLDAFYNGFDLLCALFFLAVAIAFIQNKWVSVENAAAIYTMYGALSIRFLQLGKNYPELMNCIVYAERVLEFLQIKEENTTSGNNIEISELALKGDNAVEVNDISFSYSQIHNILNKISFSIKKNETVAIVGKSGSGKTTIAKLLLGFYNVQNGEILLFGVSIKNWGLYNLRKLIAYIPQEPYLFEVTIKENIRYGNLEASDEQIIKAAKLANAHEFIINQKNGYDTLVINGGKNLSGGERQRVAIARAIIKNAPIILMDEATSALDNESERRIHESIERLKHSRTIIIIAHRQETINIADTVVEI